MFFLELPCGGIIHVENMNASFKAKKKHILEELSKPEDEYTDLSPKGVIDMEIRDLIHEINSHQGLVTTSSCAGRISVFVEGTKATTAVETTPSNASTQSSPGRWLFTSHSPIDTTVSSLTALFGLSKGSQASDETSKTLIHFKFEPFIIHILTDSIQSAQKVLTAAQQAGFRESGATGICQTKGTMCPMVAVRTNGLAFSSIIGRRRWDNTVEVCEALVPEEYLKMLVNVASERFGANEERRNKFIALLGRNLALTTERSWEDSAARQIRKRAEGLRRRDEFNRVDNGVFDTPGDSINGFSELA